MAVFESRTIVVNELMNWSQNKKLKYCKRSWLSEISQLNFTFEEKLEDGVKWQIIGLGSDFIEILEAHNGNLWKILYYNKDEIDNGEWRAVCLTYDNGCEDAVITLPLSFTKFRLYFITLFSWYSIFRGGWNFANLI